MRAAYAFGYGDPWAGYPFVAEAINNEGDWGWSNDQKQEQERTDERAASPGT